MFRKITAAIVMAAALALGVGVANASEDQPLFNCHVSGNHECGTTPGPLGFVNL